MNKSTDELTEMTDRTRQELRKPKLDDLATNGYQDILFTRAMRDYYQAVAAIYKEALETLQVLAKESWNSSGMLMSNPPVNIVSHRMKTIVDMALDRVARSES